MARGLVPGTDWGETGGIRRSEKLRRGSSGLGDSSPTLKTKMNNHTENEWLRREGKIGRVGRESGK